jgi:hypothetical protein
VNIGLELVAAASCCSTITWKFKDSWFWVNATAALIDERLEADVKLAPIAFARTSAWAGVPTAP